MWEICQNNNVTTKVPPTSEDNGSERSRWEKGIYFGVELDNMGSIRIYGKVVA
jgi:hypothetical protein